MPTKSSIESIDTSGVSGESVAAASRGLPTGLATQAPGKAAPIAAAISK